MQRHALLPRCRRFPLPVEPAIVAEDCEGCDPFLASSSQEKSLEKASGGETQIPLSMETERKTSSVLDLVVTE
jgi:hypothetical protein